MPQRQILHSWKEIAKYLGRGVRTVQRYEAELRLPIHRPAARNRSAVLAFSDELDAWVNATPKRAIGQVLHNPHFLERQRRILATHARTKRTFEAAQQVHQMALAQMQRIRELEKAITKLMASIKEQK